MYVELKRKYIIECVPQIRVSGVGSSLGTYFSLEYDAAVNAEDFLFSVSFKQDARGRRGPTVPSSFPFNQSSAPITCRSFLSVSSDGICHRYPLKSSEPDE